MKELLNSNSVISSFIKIKPRMFRFVAIILCSAILMIENLLIAWNKEYDLINIINTGMILLVYHAIIFYKSGDKFKQNCLDLIFMMTSIGSVINFIVYQNDFVTALIALTLINFSSLIYQNTIKQVFYVTILSMILAGYSIWSIGIDHFGLFLFIGVVVISTISGLIYSRINKVMEEANILLANSGQLIIEIGEEDKLKVISMGFLGNLGINKDSVNRVLKDAFQKEGMSFAELIGKRSSRSKPETHYISIANECRSVKTKVSLMQIKYKGKNTRKILLGLLLYDESDSSADSPLFVSGREDRKISLPLLINCFRRDLSQSCEGIQINYSEVNDGFENTFQTQGLFDNLSAFFRNEFELCDRVLELNFRVKSNVFLTVFSFDWEKPYASVNIPDELEKIITKNRGNIFTLIGRNNKVQIVFFLPNSEIQENSKLSFPSIDTYNDYTFLEQLTDCMNRFLNNAPFSVDLLTRELGVSRMQLHRKVKAMLGVSPGNLYQFLRMRKAKFLLISGEARVAEIAYALGYCDQSHFSKAFKAWFGVPPVHYLKSAVA